jgi:hypothetical protein
MSLGADMNAVSLLAEMRVSDRIFDASLTDIELFDR